MGGFAAGFTSGYGLVNDMEERKRRQAADEANAAALQQRYALAVREAEADAETRAYMRDQAEREADARELTARFTQAKYVQDVRDSALDRIRQGKIDDQNARESKARVEASNAQTAASKAGLEKTNLELAEARQRTAIESQQRAWTNLIGVLQQGIPASQVKPEILDSFKDLQGTPMDMFYLLNPETQRLANLAASFLSGERQLDGNEQEVNEALTFALQKDLSLLSKAGAVGRNGRINGAAVTGYDVIGQTETGMPVLNVNLRVSAEGGDYDSQITVGRSTDPNAPAASISFDEVLGAVGGYNLSLRALDEDPEFRENMRQLAYSRDPATYNTAIEAGEEAYKEYYDALPDVVKEQGYETILDPNNPDAAPVSRAIRDRQEFIDDSLALRFGPTTPDQLFGPLSAANRTMMVANILDEARKMGVGPDELAQMRESLAKAPDAVVRRNFFKAKNN
jgi:hypothetical protein